MKKTFTRIAVASIITVILGAISCSEEIQMVDHGNPLLNDLLKSDEFIRLSVPLQELDLQNAVIFRNRKEGPVIGLRFVNNPFKYLAGLGTWKDGKVEFVSVTTGEYETEVSATQLSDDLRAGTFTGTFTIANPSSKVSLHFVEGSLENADFIGGSSPKERTQGCSGIVEAGSCAAIRIDQKNWLEYTACIIDMPLCWYFEVASCLVDGCPMFHPQE